jgi:putative transposase
MQWWMTSHVRRYHRHYRSHGHVWQGRFKSFPIQQDDHELTALRTCLNRQAPFGSSDWLMQFKGVAGLGSTLRPRGRPRKTPDK